MEKDMEQLASSILGYPGKMISGSKSGYVKKNPKALAVFNANLCTTEGKFWYGDIDVTREKILLQAIAISSGKDVYLLRESDARFQYEESPRFERAMVIFHPDGSHTIGEEWVDYVSERLGEE